MRTRSHRRPTPRASAGGRPSVDHDPRRAYRKALLRELTRRGRRA